MGRSNSALEFIEDQMIGVNMHGYWNFSNADKLQITEGLTLVYGKDSKSYWYTGLTSVGKDESAVGLYWWIPELKKLLFINKVEPLNLLLKVLLKKVEKGYKASLPIPYNINNITNLCHDTEG
jgi:hypothetical protein